MNTQALNSLADLICRAQENGERTPMGIAMAIESAGRHMSPEVAADLAAGEKAAALLGQSVTELAREHEESARLRSWVGELEAVLPVMQTALFRALDRVSELEAERHVTNEALSDAAEALRVQRDRIAELEALKPAQFQTCRVCQAGYEYGQPCSTCRFNALMAAETGGA